MTQGNNLITSIIKHSIAVLFCGYVVICVWRPEQCVHLEGAEYTGATYLTIKYVCNKMTCRSLATPPQKSTCFLFQVHSKFWFSKHTLTCIQMSRTHNYLLHLSMRHPQLACSPALICMHLLSYSVPARDNSSPSESWPLKLGNQGNTFFLHITK